MGERCHDCDRPDCLAMDIAIGTTLDDAMRWRGDCRKHRVNWRTRALAADAEVKRYREALEWISEALACETPCGGAGQYSPNAADVCSLGHRHAPSWCAGCTARAALAPPPEGETDRCQG